MWDVVIRAKRLGGMRPMLEAILATVGRIRGEVGDVEVPVRETLVTLRTRPERHVAVGAVPES